MLLFSLLQAAYSYPTGAGSCVGGQAAVDGNHRNSTSVRQDNLAGQGVMVMIDDARFDPDMVFEINKDYAIVVDAGPFGNSRGVLIRVESGNPETEMFLDPVENTVSAALCDGQPGVQGLTHFNNTLKKIHSGTFRVTNPDTVQLDVTVVSRNDAMISLFQYDGFELTFQDANATVTEPPAPIVCSLCANN